MSLSRREAILGGAIAVGGAVALKAKEALAGQGSNARGWEASYSGQPQDAKPERPGEPGKDYTPVVIRTRTATTSSGRSTPR